MCSPRQRSFMAATDRPSKETHRAIWELINDLRLLRGWSPKSASDLDRMICAWGEVFNRYKVPLQAYHLLYMRAIDVCQQKLQEGKEPPEIDVTLLIALWSGPNGLREQLIRERRQRDQQTAGMASHCSTCGGSGFRSYTLDGNSFATACEDCRPTVALSVKTG